MTLASAAVAVSQPRALLRALDPRCAALREQLELRLEPGKGQLEVLVIDDAEKPAAN